MPPYLLKIIQKIIDKFTFRSQAQWTDTARVN